MCFCTLAQCFRVRPSSPRECFQSTAQGRPTCPASTPRMPLLECTHRKWQHRPLQIGAHHKGLKQQQPPQEAKGPLQKPQLHPAARCPAPTVSPTTLALRVDMGKSSLLLPHHRAEPWTPSPSLPHTALCGSCAGRDVHAHDGPSVPSFPSGAGTDPAAAQEEGARVVALKSRRSFWMSKSSTAGA